MSAGFETDQVQSKELSRSRSLYPSEWTEIIADVRNGIFCLIRRTWTSTVRGVP